MQQTDENAPPATPPRRRSIYEQDPARALGKIALFPSAYQCPWLGREHLVFGSINWHDGTTVETDEGDCFESVGHWVQAEQRRELTRLQMQNLMQSLSACPDTPAPFNDSDAGAVEKSSGSVVGGSPSAVGTRVALEFEEDEDGPGAEDEQEEEVDDDEEEEDEDEPFTNTDVMVAGSGLWISTAGDGDDEYDYENPDDPGAFLHESLAKRWAKYLPEEEEEQQEGGGEVEDERESPRSLTDMVRRDFGIMDVIEVADSPKPSRSVNAGETAPSPGLQLLRSALVLDAVASAEQDSNSNDNAENVHTQMRPALAPMVSSKIVNVTTKKVNAYEDPINPTQSADPVNAALAVFQSILNDSSWKDRQAEERGEESSADHLLHQQREVVRNVC